MAMREYTRAEAFGWNTRTRADEVFPLDFFHCQPGIRKASLRCVPSA